MSAPDTAVLDALRARIDEIDGKLVEQLADRFRVVTEVVTLKRQHAIPARLDDRIEAVVTRVRSLAEGEQCPPDLADHVWRAMIEWTIAYEERHLPVPAQTLPKQD